MIKVAFPIPKDPENPGYPPSTVETLWAALLAPLRGVLRNVPFYAKGVAFDDIVEFEVTADSAVVEFVRVVARGGHSTYRIFMLAADLSVFEVWWDRLGALGCSYERANEFLIAVDVPPSADVHAAYQVLELGEKAGIWDFEEGFYYKPEVDGPRTPASA